MARKETEIREGFSQNSRSYFFPPDESDEAVELTKNEPIIPPEQYFGEPAFMYDPSARAIKTDDEWDFMAPTRELDSTHVSDPDYLQELLSSIREDPPEAPEPRLPLDIVIDAAMHDASAPSSIDTQQFN